LNEARDGTVPDSRSLVGVQKLAALNSNTATRHVLDASVYITKSMAEALTCRISDILEYAPYKEEFITQIGRYNVSILDEIKDLYIYDFGIFIEVAPDEEEKNQLEQNVQMALQKGDINLEDAIDIREIRNIKMANQLLKLKRRKNLENLQSQEMQKQQMTIQGQMEAQRAAAQTMMMKVNAQAEADMRVKQAEVAFDIERIKAEVEAKAMLMEREFSYNIELAKAQGQALSAREEAREKEKAKRIGMQNTQQSKLIDQRKNNLPPISFESNEDSLDGFDLAEFEPR
jgi:uncharacterized lipoprotein YajG